MESTFIFPNQLFYPHPAISKKKKTIKEKEKVGYQKKRREIGKKKKR